VRSRGQVGLGDRGGKADDRIVAGVHLEHRGRVWTDGALIVAQVRAVRGADLDQAAAGRLDHVGNAERSADLDQLAARDRNLPAEGERAQRQQHAGGVVVDDRGRFGAREAAHQRFEMRVALTAPACRQIELEVAGRYERLLCSLGRLRRQQGPAEVGVQHRPGEIEYPPQRRQARRAQALQRRVDQLLRRRRCRGVALERGAPLGKHFAYGLQHHAASVRRRRGDQRRLLQQSIDRRNGGQPFAGS